MMAAIQYIILYVINFIMIIPLVLLASDYWEEGKEEGKPRGRVILTRYIQYIAGVVSAVWFLGQITSLLCWSGGAIVATAVIATTLITVVLLLASMVYAWVLEKREVARG